MAEKINTIKGLKAIVNEKSKILILGTFPGKESLESGEYYASKRNKFWNILFEMLKEDISEDYKVRANLLLKNKIAVWDVLKSCERDGSLDKKIKNPIPNNFNIFLKKYPSIRTIYFGSKIAQEYYIKYNSNSFNEDKLIILPSLSGANSTMTYEKKKNEWKVILKSIK